MRYLGKVVRTVQYGSKVHCKAVACDDVNERRKQQCVGGVYNGGTGWQIVGLGWHVGLDINRTRPRF